MRLLRAVLPVCAAAILATAAELPPAELLPPGTRIVMGISLRSLFNSPMIANFATELAVTIAPSGPLAGMNVGKDLDSLLIGTTEKENTPPVFVFRGRFHRDRTDGAKFHQGVPIFDDPRNRNQALALLDDNTAIGGLRADVEAAIDRRGQPSTLAPEIAKRVAALSDAWDFWAVGDPKVVPAAGPKGGFDAVDHFEFGASLRDGLQLRGEFHLRTSEDAAQMLQTLKLFEGLLKAQPSASATKFDLTTNNGTVAIALSIPEAELRKAVASQSSMLAGMLKGQLAAGMTGGLAPSATPAISVQGGREPASRPALTPGKVVSNDRGDSIQLTLPGGK